MTNVLYVNQVILMLDSFFYAAKPRLLREPRPMQTLHSSHPSLGAASRLSLSSLGRCTCDGPKVQSPFAPSAQEICAKNQPSSQATPSLIFYLISTCKLCSRPGLLDFSRRKRLPQSQPSLTPLSLSSLGRFASLAPSAQETCTRIGLTLRVKTFTRLVSTKRKGRESYRRSSDLPTPRWGTSHLRASHGRASLVTLKRKDRMSYRRSRNLHATCCILQHLQQSCCRTLCLIPLKRKGRLTEIDGIKICVEKILWSPPYFSLSFELQEITRFFFLLDFVQKKRPSNRYRRSRNLRTFHRHLVVAQALLCRCGVSHLISYALKRKEKEMSLSKERRKQRTPKPSLRLRQRCGRSIDRRRRRLLLLHSSLSHPSPRLVWLWSCGACLTKSAHPPFSLVGSVKARLALRSFALNLPLFVILGMVSFLAFVGASVLPSGSAAAVRSVVAGRLASLDSSSVVVVSGGASGVDSIAVDVAKSMGFETLVFAPKTNDWPGFKARNIQIAQKAGSIIVITLPLYKGGRKGECYHCNRVGKNNQHQVSGGCWTGKLHRNYEVVVLPSPLSCKQISHVGLRSASTDNNLPTCGISGMNNIFVFGSNLAGIHGAGAALHAKLHYGAPYIKNVTAEWGVKGKNGVGLQGSAYAIPTKDEWIKTLPIERIEPFVKEFIEFAKANNEMNFNVARVGCGLAGYKEHQIAPLFDGSSSNVKFNWEDYK